MTRVLGVVAGLLWVAGIVVLIVSIAVMFVGELRAGSDAGRRYDADWALVTVTTGTVLVGVAGVLTGALVLRHLRRGAG